jgi:hypothetical protein
MSAQLSVGVNIEILDSIKLCKEAINLRNANRNSPTNSPKMHFSQQTFKNQTLLFVRALEDP